MPANETNPNPAPSSTEVYAIHGADPEVLAYAMAKYSRSALSMKESLRELNAQRAEQFLNTFYFQYGHRSIADLAHIALAVERLSLLAAIALVDEQRWDGQERSTRYQNFRKSGWYLPQFGENSEARQSYTKCIEGLFHSYEEISRGAIDLLRSRVPKPAEMPPEAYERTLRARAFDGARYLLPLAANTSLGEIVNARTLETQVSRLLSHTHAEVRRLGEKLREAAATPSWNVQRAALEALQQEIATANPALGERAAAVLLREVPVAPTLVKYAAPIEYIPKTRVELEQAARELMRAQAIAPAPLVDLIEPEIDGHQESIEIEIVTTLLYSACHYPYRQIREQVAALDSVRREELLALGTRHRGRHDELSRAFASGYCFRFDILMDIGGFRDMHRHRRCVQTIQSFTNLHGYDVPEMLAELGPASALRAGGRSRTRCFRLAIPSRSSRGKCDRAICTAARHALPLAIQDGLRRSPLYRRAAQRAPRPYLLSPRGMGNVSVHCQTTPRAGEEFPRDGCEYTHRSAAAVKCYAVNIHSS